MKRLIGKEKIFINDHSIALTLHEESLEVLHEEIGSFSRTITFVREELGHRVTS